jgi:hypothetical protein
MKKKLTAREKVVKSLEKEYHISLMPAFKWYEGIREQNKARLCQKYVPARQDNEEKPECPWKGFKLNPEIIDGYVF